MLTVFSPTKQAAARAARDPDSDMSADRSQPLPQPDRLLVWLGNPFFSRHLEDRGWRVVRPPYVPGTLYAWQDILALTGGEQPDLVLAADASTPPFLLGVEDFPCLTAWYSVDAHIHAWHPLYAQAFDFCLVSLREHLPAFARGRLATGRVFWSPPYAEDRFRPPAEPLPAVWDLLFVGSTDPALAPGRCAFLQAVKEGFDGLHVTRGHFPTLFPQAGLVLNECSRGELNFRVFEALGCGACLVTPDIGPALTDLFTPGETLFVYPDKDVPALIALVRRLLADEPLRRRVAAAGLAEVDARHRASIRAGRCDALFRTALANGQAGRIIAERRALAPGIFRHCLRLLYLHLAEGLEQDDLRAAYLQAASNGPR